MVPMSAREGGRKEGGGQRQEEGARCRVKYTFAANTRTVNSSSKRMVCFLDQNHYFV